MSSEVIATYVNIILYAISYQLQRPVEPFLVKSLIHNIDDGSSEETKSNQTFGRKVRVVEILLLSLQSSSNNRSYYLLSSSSYIAKRDDLSD